MPAAAVHIELVFSRPETTLSVTRGAARLLVDMGYAPLLEVGLPNGRRADVMALGPKGDIVICEVKSGIEDYRVDRKWGEYGPYCDAFYFAVAPEFPEPYVLLSVRDNGLGMNGRQQEQLFTMFRRFHDHVEGSGVGLFMVKRILENAGGKIEVESEEGSGTEFKLYFKAAV